jgi:hypothetical protein
VKRAGRRRAQTPSGQLELAFDVPQLTDDQRAEFAAYVMPGWQGMGACRSVANDTWFPEPDYVAPTDAVSLCSECPVRRSCLAFALAEELNHGIWGGTTPALRDVIRQDVVLGHAVSDLLDRCIRRLAAQPLLMRQAVAS